jgi:O-antigen/teichoic acid export membrane protein
MSRLRRALAPGNLARSSAQTIGATAVVLALNLVTGIMVARLLGAAGRGELAALVTLGQTLGWLASLGCFQAVGYFNSRQPENADATIGTWVALSLPLGLAGVLVGQLLAGTLLAAQSDEVVTMARLWLLMVALMPLSEALSGALVADRDFGAMNSYRLLQAALPVPAYLVLWGVGAFTVEAVLLTHVAVIAVYLTLLLHRVRSRHSIGRPRADLAREGLWYGARAHASNVSAQLNARLDLLIMPALLAATQVGLYAVAVSIANMIVTLAGSLAMIALPVASGGGAGSDRSVVRLMHATATTGLALATFIFVLAEPLLTLVYSSAFADAATALRWLAPGAVLLAMANISVNGLYGQGRPGVAGLAQLPGVAITVVGLLLFVRSGGIDAAAIISTVTYGTTCLLTTLLFVHRAELSWSTVLDGRTTLRMVADRLRQARAGRSELDHVAREVAGQ